MVMLDQVYYNATDAFAQDPALRELLRSTMDQASVDSEIGLTPQPGIPGGPAPGGVPRQIAGPNKADRLPEAAANQAWEAMPKLPARSVPLSDQDRAIFEQSRSNPIGVQGGVPGSPMPRPAMQPQYGPRPETPAAPAPRGPLPDASRGSGVGAFLSGLGASDAILPAIGGGIQAVEKRDTENSARNQTLRALVNRGLDHDTALAAVSNPEILKAVLPGLFGGQGGNIESIFDADTGLERKVIIGKNGKVTPIGGLKRDPGFASMSKAQQTANVKRVESYKGEADAARSTIGQLAQLEELRKDANYEGIPFAESVADFLSWSGLGETTGLEKASGAGASLASNAATLQLGFTSLTKGAISDREMALFGTATPGIKMGEKAAANVMAGMRAGAERVIERSKFFERWMGTNRGSLEGAQESWDQYVSANPIIDKTPEGIRVNRKNIGNWQEYVLDHSGGGTPTAPQRTAPPTGSTQSKTAAPGGRPMPGGGLAASPHDTGEAVPGMKQLQDGTWVMPDPNSKTGYKRWVP